MGIEAIRFQASIQRFIKLNTCITRDTDMNTQTMMRTDKKLLEAIKGLKKHRRESYADVIERLVDNERKV